MHKTIAASTLLLISTLSYVVGPSLERSYGIVGSAILFLGFVTMCLGVIAYVREWKVATKK